MDEQKYFNQGDVVVVRQDLPEKPRMIVERVERTLLNTDKEKSRLIGIRCIWFDKNHTLQKHTFNTKDLEFAD